MLSPGECRLCGLGVDRGSPPPRTCPRAGFSLDIGPSLDMGDGSGAVLGKATPALACIYLNGCSFTQTTNLPNKQNNSLKIKVVQGGSGEGCC